METPFDVKGKAKSEVKDKDHVVIGQAAYPGPSTKNLSLDENVERMKDANLDTTVRKVASLRAAIQYLNAGTGQNEESASTALAILLYRVKVLGQTATLSPEGIKFE